MTPRLETKRLVLEPLRIEHASLCFDALQDPSLYRYVPQDPPASLEALERRFQTLERGAPTADEVWLNWFSRLPSSEIHAGFVQATVRPGERYALIAYQTFSASRRQGYAKEACAEALRFLARAFPIDEVRAEIDTRNDASRALVESLGFVAGPVREDADFFKGCSSHELTYRLAIASLG